MSTPNGRSRGNFQWRDLDRQADSLEFFLEHANEGLDPNTADLAAVRVRLKGLVVTLDLGEPGTAQHKAFRLHLARAPFDRDGTFHPLSVGEVVRWQYLKNRWRDAERIARSQLYADLRAGRVHKVTAAQFHLLTGLPADAFDLMKKDPHCPTVWTDAYGSGVRYVYASDLLRWVDSLDQKKQNNRLNGYDGSLG